MSYYLKFALVNWWILHVLWMWNLRTFPCWSKTAVLRLLKLVRKWILNLKRTQVQTLIKMSSNFWTLSMTVENEFQLKLKVFFISLFHYGQNCTFKLAQDRLHKDRIQFFQQFRITETIWKVLLHLK